MRDISSVWGRIGFSAEREADGKFLRMSHAPMSERLFVYGTLRTPVGGPPGDTHYHAHISTGISGASSGALANAELVDFGSYPGVGPGNGVVRGEVFTISEDVLDIADQVEGHPDFYERRIEVITLDDGTSTEAWVYWAPEDLLRDPDNPRIASGDWFDRERRSTFPSPIELSEEPDVVRGFERLGAARDSWLSTVRTDGRPHSVPMWHVIVGNRLYYCTYTSAVKLANIAKTPHVVVSHPDPQDVAIIDGWAIEAPHLLDALAPFFLEKYDWDFGRNDFEGEWTAIEVTPRVLRTWQDEHSHRRWNIGTDH